MFRARVEPAGRFSISKLKRCMTRFVADGVGIDFRRANAIEEAQRENPGNQRAGTGVVRLEDGLAAVGRDDVLQPVSDFAERRIP